MSPDAHTNEELMLPVGHGHTLYVHDWGNKKAKTVVLFLHGGPGGACRDKHKLPFDPKTQRVIFHDQRGAGRSTPLGKAAHNNTQELAADITKIADHFDIDSFILTGESWGSCLALYYALCVPKRVKALVIGGVFTGSRREIDWIDRGVFRTHFPDAWDRYLELTPRKYRDDPSSYHFPRILGNDPELAKQSAYAYSNLVSSCVQLNDDVTPEPYEDFDPGSITTEVRYMTKRCYLTDRFILKNAHKLKMPAYIVQGRYDFVCPPATAYELSKVMPHVQLIWTVAGHRNEHESTQLKKVLFSQLEGVR